MNSAAVADGQVPKRRYGSFRLGGVHLALPMEALREVVPCGELLTLPSKAAGLMGGLNLRGVVIPVVDLRPAIGRPVAPIESACVVVMLHGGNIVGLLADGVSGIFTENERSSNTVSVADRSSILYSKCLPSGDGTMVSVLSPEAIARLPGLPMVTDPEPARGALQASENADSTASAGATKSDKLQMLVVRCGRTVMALDAMSVHTTLSDLVIDSNTPLAAGHCRGVIEHAGVRLPAVDLLELCGLGTLPPTGKPQAFVMTFPKGMLALLVDDVLDIRSFDRAEILALPAFALRSTLFAGIVRAPGDSGGPPFFVLDVAAMIATDELAALASTSKVTTSVSDQRSVAKPSANMLTYHLEVETATPLDQVTEILPFSVGSSTFDSEGSMLGVLVSRGRSIPLLCLSALTSSRPLVTSSATSVLVVESGGELMGFVVPGLKAIEPTQWQPEVCNIGRPKVVSSEGDAACTQLALMGAGVCERMVPVLDLKRLAASIQAR